MGSHCVEEPTLGLDDQAVEKSIAQLCIELSTKPFSHGLLGAM